MTVDVSRWKDACKTERKLANYLNVAGVAQKIADIEYAILDLRRHHNLSTATIQNVIDVIVYSDRRAAIQKKEAMKRDEAEKERKDVKNFVLDYISRIESGEALTNSKERYSKGSCRNWRQFKRNFLEFYSKNPFSWEDINDQLVDKYINYLESVGYMINTVNKRVSLLKTVISSAERQGIHSNHIASSLCHRKTVREKDVAKKIYLSKQEIDALYAMKLEGIEEQVRDVFLVGCYTGLRVSDYCRIDSSCINHTPSGTKVIRITQQKTGATVIIPLLDDRLEALLKKYNYNIPHVNGASINRTIKSICERLSHQIASLSQKEITTLNLKERRAEDRARSKGKSLYEYDRNGRPVKPKWAMVSSHTARRSCVTNMYLSHKFTIAQMMSVSGHKSEAQFHHYVKLTLDEIADNVAESAGDGLF